MMSRGRARLVTAEQELSEIRRRDANDRALKRRADGLPIEAQIKEAHRYDWARRYTAATEAAEESEETLEVGFIFLCFSVADMTNRLSVSPFLVTTAFVRVGLQPLDPNCIYALDFRVLRFRLALLDKAAKELGQSQTNIDSHDVVWCSVRSTRYKI